MNEKIDESNKKPEPEHPNKIENFVLSVERNVLKNTRFYFIIFLVVYLYNTIEQSAIKDRLTSIEKRIDSGNRATIGMTDSGVVIGISKQALKIKDMHAVVANYIEDYLVQSRHSLLDYSGKRGFNNATDLYKSQDSDPESKNLRSFFNYFVDKSVDKNGVSHAKDSYGKYLTKLVIWVRNNDIPTSIEVHDRVYDLNRDWSVNGNKFRLNIEVKTIISGVTKGGLKYTNRRSKGSFEVTGYIDHDKRDPVINPFGVMFTRITSNPPKNATDVEVKRMLDNKKIAG